MADRLSENALPCGGDPGGDRYHQPATERLAPPLLAPQRGGSGILRRFPDGAAPVSRLAWSRVSRSPPVGLLQLLQHPVGHELVPLLVEVVAVVGQDTAR